MYNYYVGLVFGAHSGSPRIINFSLILTFQMSSYLVYPFYNLPLVMEEYPHFEYLDRENLLKSMTLSNNCVRLRDLLKLYISHEYYAWYNT